MFMVVSVKREQCTSSRIKTMRVGPKKSPPRDAVTDWR